MASFDDLGKIAPSAWVLEKGRYALYVGTSVRDTVELDWEQPETEVVGTVSDSLAPSHLEKRMLADGSCEQLPAAPEVDTDANLLRPIPAGQAEAVAPAQPGRDRWMLTRPFVDGVQPLSAVAEGKLTLEEFMTQLSDGDLVHLLGAAAAAEVKENNISVWLAPAVNIHQSPLCGRNFEYWSEDPLLTGKLAGAMVQGIQSRNIAATVKHFACNNKETNRKYSDSRLSQRALRELYLRAFEIIVREAQPWAIMSSYNVINGRRASESRELLTDILRGDWGYIGMVMTDWWTRGEHFKEILAGNDQKMASGYPERVEEAMRQGAVSRRDLEICVE